MPESERLVINDATRLRPGRGIQSKQSGPLPVEPGERIANQDLNRAIQEAGDARQQVSNYEALQRKSAELETLERERLRRIEVSQAQENYANERATIKDEINQIKGRIRDWRAELYNLEEQFQASASELQSIQTAIFASYQRVVTAQQTAFYAGGQAPYDPNIPHVAQVQPDSISAWLAIVGNDADLQTVNKYQHNSLLRDALVEAVKAVYINAQQLRRLSQFTSLR